LGKKKQEMVPSFTTLRLLGMHSTRDPYSSILTANCNNKAICFTRLQQVLLILKKEASAANTQTGYECGSATTKHLETPWPQAEQASHLNHMNSSSCACSGGGPSLDISRLTELIQGNSTSEQATNRQRATNPWYHKERDSS